MVDWIDYDQWHLCAQMEAPGIIFEIRNDDGLSLFTPCATDIQVPSDWQSPPTTFRPVPEPQPRHSSPLPEPRKQR